tara:strand:- start:3368 stop:4066 length:699 start_codon:yes stop_codon:yes gene_type:complete
MSPEAPVPVFKISHTENQGGMALNVKSNLEGLGVKVDTLTNVEEIIKVRHIDLKSRQHLLRVDWGEEQSVEPLSVDLLDASDFDLYDGIVISDYDKGLITPEVIDNILSRCPNKPIFVDSKKKDLSPYEGCILKINEKESHEAQKLPSKCELIVTLGDRGASYNGEEFGTKKVEIFDVCGAGDTFLAGLSASFLLTNKMKRSITFANLCGGIAVQKFGTYTIKKEDLYDIYI